MAAERLLTTVARTVLVIACQDCDWTLGSVHGPSYDADRMKGRRHAASKGHLVVAESSRTITWDGRGGDDGD